MYSRALAIAFCILTLACGATAPAPTPSPTPAPPPPSRTFTLSGRVSDVNTGGPLAGATITILDGDNASRFTTSDAIGAFHLTDVIFGGFTVRVRHDAYDSVFRGITFVQDTSIDVQMRPVMQSLSGTWTGTFSFSPASGARQDLNVPQLTMEHPGSGVSSTFLSAGPYSGSFSGTLQDPSAITSTTQVMGTLTLINNLAGRNPTTCRGVGNFTGTVNWTRFVITVPQITVDCGTVYTTVTLSLVRQQ